MTKTELIFLPAPPPGHIVSTVEFAKRLMAREANLSITVLVITSPLFHSISITDDTIRFIKLPQLDVPPPSLFEESLENAFSQYLASHVPHVRATLSRLIADSSGSMAGLFLDMFCHPFIDVAKDLGINSYVFFCSSAAFLGLLLHLPDQAQKSGETRFEESDIETIVPSFQNPVLTKALPSFAFNRVGYKALMDHAKRYRELKGIVVNTCSELEPFAIKALSHAYRTAPVYTVGPVMDLNGQVRRRCNTGERDQIMHWLDRQSENSVVYLCFGSEGSMSEDQIREISKGLMQSNQRFLWSLRKPPTGDSLKHNEYTQTELKRIFPEEFQSLLEKELGLVCGWAPQVEVLAHKATGAFVSHCGWNSVLESAWFGKPMVTWPLYAEQQVIAFEVVKELGVGVELRFDYELKSGEVVVARDVEKAIMCVMVHDSNVRSRAKEMMEVCRASLMEGGSSLGCVDRLIREFKADSKSNVNH